MSITTITEKELPWASYPRPQLVREKWMSLNGEWTLTYGRKSGTITVPFCPECELSGSVIKPGWGEEFSYHRSFFVPTDWYGQRIILHFGAVSRLASIIINGCLVFTNSCSYLPFSIDITEHVKNGENDLCVRAANDISHKYPWGKQKADRGGMWYTPVSGIWQSVWLEPVPAQYISGLEITTGADYAVLKVEGVESGTVSIDGSHIDLINGQAVISFDNPKLWSPDEPYLYNFTIDSGEDRISSYLALRTLSTKRINGKLRLCLNGKPFFFHGLLDQGYWNDGLYTPKSPQCYADDILKMKALGFNTLRKHIKIEPEQFYYDCDRLGMVVFQDMINNGEYNYLRDTILPTLGFQTRSDRQLNTDPAARRIFLDCMEKTVRLLKNHPSICYWTIFNEGWGQFLSDGAYELLKSIDDSRFIDSTSGWFHQKRSDVDSLHIYFSRLKLGHQDLPQVLSEFGGYAWKLPDHCFNISKTYGYRKYSSEAALTAALRAVYLNHIIPLTEKGLCAAIYTQLSDVEDETNGMLTYDRSVCKVRPENMADIAHQLQEAVKK